MEIRDRDATAQVGEEGVETEGGKGGCHVTGRGSPGCLKGAHQNM